MQSRSHHLSFITPFSSLAVFCININLEIGTQAVYKQPGSGFSMTDFLLHWPSAFCKQLGTSSAFNQCMY